MTLDLHPNRQKGQSQTRRASPQGAYIATAPQQVAHILYTAYLPQKSKKEKIAPSNMSGFYYVCS